MAKVSEPQLDERLLRLLDGRDLDTKVGLAMQLTTVDPTGMPHSALLSVGEVVAVAPRLLRLATWGSSATTNNMRRTGDALLTVVLDGACYGIEFAVTEQTGSGSPVEETALPGLAVFAADVRCVHRDEVTYAQLLSGIEFRLVDPEPVLVRWRNTVDALREFAAKEDAAR